MAIYLSMSCLLTKLLQEVTGPGRHQRKQPEGPRVVRGGSGGRCPTSMRDCITTGGGTASMIANRLLIKNYDCFISTTPIGFSSETVHRALRAHSGSQCRADRRTTRCHLTPGIRSPLRCSRYNAVRLHTYYIKYSFR